MLDIKNLIMSRLDRVKSLTRDGDLRKEIVSIPKYELHVHLGGSIRRETVVELAKKNRVDLPATKKNFLEASTPLEFFYGEEMWEIFHQAYMWHMSCVKSCEDLEKIVFEFLEDSHLQGVVHSEFTVSGSYLMNAFPFDEWTDAVSKGIYGARKAYRINGAAILDISRRFGPENALKIVERVSGDKSSAICAIGMGGDEVKYPHHLFKGAFELARKKKINSTVHVSEFRGAESTSEVIEILKPDRLGHALTTVQSEKAYSDLKSSGTPVECCPLCNYVGGMGGLISINDHPVRKYFMEKIPVTINTDDPRIFGFDLIDNYLYLLKETDFSLNDFKELNESAKNQTFC